MMESYFSKFRENIIGINQKFDTPFKKQIPILYADWTASGRLYKPIEETMCENIFPFVANTHTETNTTGKGMTLAYRKALQKIKEHVNANDNDAILSYGSGMTGAVNKFQRILGLKAHEKYKDQVIDNLPEEERPIVFISHMEHHSNQTSWLETLADVQIIEPDDEGLVDLDNFEELLEKYKHRKTKYAAVTSCSNVTGIMTPYHEIAEMIHKAGGYCFVDFAASGPYVDINMHPENELQKLDAIYFSPHKFLGGPGSSGILIFCKKLYNNSIPDNPGGGTVEWTNPWGEHKYFDDIESREDGGTPAFIQTIKTALAIKLKDEMGVENILKREKEQMKILWNKFIKIPNLRMLAENQPERIGIISFFIDGLHHNLGVKILNDRFGIQVRGGCSCAGTYGHYLLHVDKELSCKITELINKGDYSEKPGWIRLSIHPTMTNAEIEFLADAIEQLSINHTTWQKDYNYDLSKNLITINSDRIDNYIDTAVDSWFEVALS